MVRIVRSVDEGFGVLSDGYSVRGCVLEVPLESEFGVSERNWRPTRSVETKVYARDGLERTLEELVYFDLCSESRVLAES
jgi:hypothetical protein